MKLKIFTVCSCLKIITPVWEGQWRPYLMNLLVCVVLVRAVLVRAVLVRAVSSYTCISSCTRFSQCWKDCIDSISYSTTNHVRKMSIYQMTKHDFSWMTVAIYESSKLLILNSIEKYSIQLIQIWKLFFQTWWFFWNLEILYEGWTKNTHFLNMRIHENSWNCTSEKAMVLKFFHCSFKYDL